MYYFYTQCILLATLLLSICVSTNYNGVYGLPDEFPCPVPEDIDPCTCQYDPKLSILNLDCSHVTDGNQLYHVLQAAFPVSTFHNFTIDSNSFITEIINDTFASITFEEVWISFSTLQTIQTNAFAGMESTLKRLYLFHNSISTFPFNVLDKFIVLEELSLISNDITHVPLIDSKSLTYLELGLNPLHDIPIEPFNQLPKLREVRMENTGLRALKPGLFVYNTEIEFISLWGNELRHLESHWFSFSGIDRAKTIVLNHNYISIVHQEVFSGLTGADIFLEYNKIIELEESVWTRVLNHNNTIHLQGNHLQCSCNMAWLVVSERALLDQVVEAKCSNGTYLADLNPEAFRGCNTTTPSSATTFIID